MGRSYITRQERKFQPEFPTIVKGFCSAYLFLLLVSPDTVNTHSIMIQKERKLPWIPKATHGVPYEDGASATPLGHAAAAAHSRLVFLIVGLGIPAQSGFSTGSFQKKRLVDFPPEVLSQAVADQSDKLPPSWMTVPSACKSKCSSPT